MGISTYIDKYETQWKTLGCSRTNYNPCMNKSLNKPTSVDLFCGAGGFTEGLHAAGFDSVYAADFDEQAIETFRYNHPAVKAEVADVSALTAEHIRASSGLGMADLDLLVGGPPCQGFSLAGLRLPHDPKNRLYLEFVRLAAELKPKVVVMENVQGIETMSRGAVVRAIHASMEDIGYNVSSATIIAADYGVPQLRPRFIMIAVREGSSSLPTPTHARDTLTFETLFNLPTTPTVRQAIEDLPAISQGEGAEEMFHDQPPTDQYQVDRRGSRTPGSIYNHRATRHSQIVIERYALIPEGSTNAVVPENLRTKKINVYRLRSDRPSRTVTCNFRTDLLHPWENRGLTVREAARLQSFDDDYKFFGNLTRKAKWLTQDDQVGNAVPPLLAKAIGQHILSKFLS